MAGTAAHTHVAIEGDAPGRHPQLLLAALFVASGFSALCYQVILSRYTQVIVGATAHAISALLVAFMSGMAVGSALGGRLADRWQRPLRLYALAEAGIGLYCLAFPLLFPLFERLYLETVPDLGSGSLAARNAVRFLAGVAAFFLPSVFMGITTPAFARAVAAHRPDSGRWLARLYGWNTLGAALGALATAYVLVPLLGMVGSMTLAACLNFSVALLAVRLAAPVPPSAAPTTESAALAAPQRSQFLVLVQVAFASGFFSFGLEIIWTHLLAVLLGNSVYAFGLMLGSLLLGLALGTLVAHRVAEPLSRARQAIGLCLAASGLTVVLTLGVWDQIPALFLLLARSSPSFWMLEAVRFGVALLLMLAPTVFLGACFPLVLHCAASAGRGFGSALGVVYAANTIGACGGAVLASYLLLPALGSLAALRILGGGLLVTGALALVRLATPRRRLALAGAAALSAALGATVPVRWDFNSLNLAAAVYLGSSLSQKGEIVFQREDASGGLTTVVQYRGVKTLLTNGKFQGDDSEEVPIQHRLANIPTLFTPQRQRALVIGLGTGVTLASMAAHGFEEVVCAEISDPIIAAARQHFGGVNQAVLDSPRLRLYHEDGRSVLLERPDRYDVVSVEVTTIWFAGVGSVYSQEFYRLVSSRLRRQGVLLQWFPAHHLSPRNLYIVVNTIRSVFPYVSVWTHRHQGFVVASNEPLELDVGSVRDDRQRPTMRPFLRGLQSGSPLELLSDLVVHDGDVDRFLDGLAGLLRTDRDLVATDTWPILEYETPKDILDNFSYFQNRATFQRFRSTRPFPLRGAPSVAERALVDAAFAHGWADPRALPRLSRAWHEAPEYTVAVSRWLADEVTREDFAGAGFGDDPLVTLSAQMGELATLLSSVGTQAECVQSQSFSPSSVPLEVSDHGGLTILPTQPGAAVDGVVSPDWATGWHVRPEGVPPWLEVKLDRPRRLRSVGLVVRPLDSATVRTRILGQDASGRWSPLAAGARGVDILCTEARIVRLPDDTPPLAALRIEMQGEALSHRLALHEVWVSERD
jgi:spermidine synthase